MFFFGLVFVFNAMNKLKLNKKNRNSEGTPGFFLIFIPGHKFAVTRKYLQCLFT